jgi:hemolysin activation/secretion protein
LRSASSALLGALCGNRFLANPFVWAPLSSATFLRPVVLAGFMLVAGGVTGEARGQSDAQYPRDQTPRLADSPLGDNAGSRNDRVILPELKGVMLLGSAAAVRKSGASGTGIMVEDVPALDDSTIRDRLAAYIGKPLTQATLKAIGQTITDWYLSQKYPFVDIALPAGQDVTNGVVQIVVTESRAGKVTARGNKWFSDDLLVSQVRLQPGDRINIQDLEADKNWLNQNQFRQINIVAERDPTPGVTDFIVDTVQEKFPFRVYAGYDNSGTPILGHDRWNLGFNWGNVFDLDQQFSYQFTSSDDFWHSREQIPGRSDNPNFMAHSVSYVIPLPWRDQLTIYGSYVEASPRLGPYLGETGVNGVAGIRYAIQLPSAQNFDERIQVGYEFKTSNNDLEFGGFEVSNITTEIDQFLVDYDATLRDDYGQTTLDNTLVLSPGNITAQNKDVYFGAQMSYAKANYVYDHVAVTRVTGLPKDSDMASSLGWLGGASLISKVVAQISNGNLLPSEQLGAGGADSVRGYDERAANGADGVILSQEIRTPMFSLAKAIINTDSSYKDQTQLAAFFDYGSVWDVKTLPGSPNSTELTSAGLGFHTLSGPDGNFRIDLNYGWQLRKLPFAADHSEFGHIAVTAAY